jgi:acetolactate synthase-1/2/3 large subunit
MLVADYIFNQLSRFGVEDVFFLPGGGAMYLNDALGRSKINPVCCLQEQTTGIAAEAYGKYHHSKIGVALVTSGPGSTNVITPVVGAWIESNSLLIISGQVKRSDLNKSKLLRQSGVQEVDIVSMVDEVTKFSYMVEDPLEIGTILKICIEKSISGRKGPCWLDIPLDVQAFMLPDDYPDIDFSTLNSNEIYISDKDIDNAFNLLIASERPLLLVGQGLRGNVESIKKFAEKFKIPVLTTFPALDLFEYDHSLFVGRPGGVSVRSANFAVQNCDLLLSVGSSLNNVITAYNPSGFATVAKKIIVDIDKNELEKHNLQNAILIESDAQEFISKLCNFSVNDIDFQPSPLRQEWIEFCLDLKNKYSDEYKQFISPEIKEISHYDLVNTLSNGLPECANVATGSSGLGIEVFYAYFKNRKDQKICITSGMGSMGYALPTAVGMAMALKEKKIYCIEGDGSLQMNIQELALVRGLNLPILFIIMNNGGYASIRNSQTTYFKQRFIGVGNDSGLHLPDLEKIAFGYDIPYTAIRNLDKLVGVLEKKDDYLGGPLIAEVFLNPYEKLFPKVQANIGNDGKITSMPIEDMAPLLEIQELRAAMKYSQIKKESFVAREISQPN